VNTSVCLPVLLCGFTVFAVRKRLNESRLLRTLGTLITQDDSPDAAFAKLLWPSVDNATVQVATTVRHLALFHIHVGLTFIYPEATVYTRKLSFWRLLALYGLWKYI